MLADASPTPMGYSDFNICCSVTLDDGTEYVCELQINHTAMLAAKKKAHVHYEIVRAALPALCAGSNADPTELEVFIVRQLNTSNVDVAVASLSAKADGLFLYAHLLDKHLEAEELAGREIAFASLDTLPSGLDEVYRVNFLRAFPSGIEDAAWILAKPLVELIAAAMEPLSLPMVAALLDWDESDQVSVLRTTSLLFPLRNGFFHVCAWPLVRTTRPRPNLSTLRMLSQTCRHPLDSSQALHKTVVDWLVGDAEANASLATRSELFHIERCNGHVRFAKGFLAWLSPTPMPDKHVHKYGHADGCTSSSSSTLDYWLRHGVHHLYEGGHTQEAETLLGRCSCCTCSRCFRSASRADESSVLTLPFSTEVVEAPKTTRQAFASLARARDALSLAGGADATLSEVCQMAQTVATEHGLPSKELWRVLAMDRLLAIGVVQPWPATAVALAADVPGAPEALAALVQAHLPCADPFVAGARVSVDADCGDCWSCLEGRIRHVQDGGKFTVELQDGRPQYVALRNRVTKIDALNSGFPALMRTSAAMGAADVVKALVEAKANVWVVDPHGNNALHYAAAMGNAPVCKALKSTGIDPMMHNHRTSTSALNLLREYATSKRHTACVNVLLPSASDKELTEDTFASPLLRSAADSDAAAVTALLAGGTVDPDTTTANGVTALHHACRVGATAVVELLLAQGADVNRCTDSGISAVLLAAEGGSHPTVELLIAQHADAGAVDTFGRAPLDRAAAGDFAELCGVLLDAGADIARFSNARRNALGEACLKGSRKAVELLLRRGADVLQTAPPDEKVTKWGRSALLEACSSNQLEIARWLIRAKADVNAQDRVPLDESSGNLDGWSPLIESACKGRLELVELLLKEGADPNLNLKGCAGALYFSACNGHLETSRVLVDAGVASRDSNHASTPCNARHPLVHRKLSPHFVPPACRRRWWIRRICPTAVTVCGGPQRKGMLMSSRCCSNARQTSTTACMTAQSSPAAPRFTWLRVMGMWMFCRHSFGVAPT